MPRTQTLRAVVDAPEFVPPSAPTPIITPPSTAGHVPPSPRLYPAGAHPPDSPPGRAEMERAALPSEDVLALPPAEAAQRLLRQARAHDAADARSRLAEIGTQLEDLVERARTSNLSALHFTQQAGGLLQERTRLDDVLRLLGQTPPDRADPAAEVLALLQSVRRYRSGGIPREFRAIRVKSLDKLPDELAALEDHDFGLRATLAAVPHALWGKPVAEWLDKMAGFISHRQDLRRRLAALDPASDTARREMVASVIDKAGGLDEVAAGLAEKQPVPPGEREAQAVAVAIGGMDRRIAELDNESRAHADLVRERQSHQERHDALLELAKGQRQQMAREKLQAATTGRLDALDALAEMLRDADRAELASSVEAIRGDNAVMTAIVRELI
jgi:hypothetical protein